MIQGRIQKNRKRLKPWADRNKLTAYRLYDWDIPEFPFFVDYYAGHLLVYDKSNEHLDAGKNHLQELLSALKAEFPEAKDKIIVKKRQRLRTGEDGLQQYEKMSDENVQVIIQEGAAKLIANLTDYLDTGVFLDHRPLRQKIYKTAEGKKFLNLFCYTGAFSVQAALGHAESTLSVDMSKTYLDWAQKNFEVNHIDLENHQFLQIDVLQFLKDQRNQPRFDLILLDPPTFSNSKRMEREFEVEKDHESLIHDCMSMLKPAGKLYFSTNKRKFKLAENLFQKYRVSDLSKESIPQDFHDQKVHQCFQIEK